MKKEEITHLATLARIAVTDEEAAALAEDISNIIGYVSDINAITGDGDAAKTVGAVHTVLREDEITNEPGTYTEQILEAAPGRHGQFIEVKKILGGDN